VKKQQPRNEAKQAQRNRLPFREHLIKRVHVVSPSVDPSGVALSQYAGVVTGV
jgi:hypothetical protein